MFCWFGFSLPGFQWFHDRVPFALGSPRGVSGQHGGGAASLAFLFSLSRSSSAITFPLRTYLLSGSLPPVRRMRMVRRSCYRIRLIDIEEGGVRVITLIARLPIIAGKMDEALGAFRELMAQVANEEGTILYSLNAEKGEPDTLVVVEQYRDEDSLKYHSSTSHFKEFSAKSVSFASGKPEVVLMEEIDRT